jgi:DNA gyrase subunit B
VLEQHLVNELKAVSLSMFRKDFLGIFHGSISAKIENNIFVINKSDSIFDELVDEDFVELYDKKDYRWNCASQDADIHLHIYKNISEAKYVYERLNEREIEIFNNKDILDILEEVEEKAKKGAYIQRYKGLGEMNPDQLWETTMSKENRTLLQVRVDNIEEVSDVFTLFMGDEVEPRRKYIQEHAKDVKHLDI